MSLPNAFLDARQAQALFQQAMVLHQQGQLKDAETMYRRILQAQPRNVDCLHLLGVIAFQAGDHRRAVDLIGRAIGLYPGSAAFYANRGNALLELGEAEAALADYDKAVALKSDYAQAYNNRGSALQELKRLDEALASFDKALALEPGYANAYNNRGRLLQDLKRFGDAAANFDKAVALDPGFVKAHSNLGNILRELGRRQDALAAFDKAIALQPDYAEAYNNRGNVLHELGLLDAALADFDKAVALKPALAEAHGNRGSVLHDLARYDEAIASFEKAVSLKPNFGEALWNKSLTLLLTGRLEEGFQLYEWGRLAGQRGRQDLRQPLWLGEADLAGKTILLHAEQGLGDAIQFCRYIPMTAALGARVILEVPPALTGLMRGLDCASDIVATGNALPEFDCHAPLLSLPLAFKTGLDTIPPGICLRGDSGKRRAWSEKLGPRTKPRVGLAWSGNRDHKKDHKRSIALAQLLRRLPGACEYVSLQKELREDDRAALKGHASIRHFGEELTDFTDTAALCDLMDVIVSVDTSVAHLAGALGKETWLMLSHVPDWRWLLGRADSPWYPSMRLYRQPAIGDWDNVLVKVAADLAQFTPPPPPA